MGLRLQPRLHLSANYVAKRLSEHYGMALPARMVTSLMSALLIRPINMSCGVSLMTLRSV